MEQKATNRIFDAGLLGIAGAGGALLYGLMSLTGLFAPGETLSAANTGKSAPAVVAAGPRVEHLLGPATNDYEPARVVREGHATLQIAPVSLLRRYYDSIGFDLSRVRDHGRVPRLILAALPRDIQSVEQPRLRKMLFMQTTLPMILHVNEKIMADRKRVMSLRGKAEEGGVLSPAEKRWLTDLSVEYGAGGENPDPQNPDFASLLKRVDILPPSLALAQSAEESGWGTSRFAREGNALFGQRTWRGPKGMIPKKRAAGEKYRVRSFDTLLEGVWAYAYNLNTHFAYAKFRERRARLRAAGNTLTGDRLIDTLDRYSERGQDYIRTIRTIMRVNALSQFDGARLSHPPVLPPEPSSGA